MKHLCIVLFLLLSSLLASAQIPNIDDDSYVKFTAGNVTWLAPMSALKAYIGASKIIMEESTPLPNRDTIRFIGAGITASDANGTRTEVALDGDLNAVAGLSTTGIVVRTGTDAFTTRSLSTATSISGLTYAWSNADGVSGAPAFNVNIGLLPWKHFAEVATTANITLSGNQTIDGVTTTANMRVLVKNQSTASQNGVYTAAAGAWSRASDLDLGSGELDAGAFVAVRRGTANANTVWQLTTAPPITVGTTAQTWAKVLPGVETVAVSARLTGDGTGSAPLDLAQQSASAGQALKWNGSSWAPADDLEGISGAGTSGRVAYWNGTTSLSSSADFRHDVSGNMLHLDDTLWTTKLIRSNVPSNWWYRLTNRPDAGINAQHTQSDPGAVTTMSLGYGSLNVGNTNTTGLPTGGPNIRLYRARMSGSNAVPAEAGDMLGFMGFQCHRGQSTSIENMYDLTNGGLIIGATVDSVAADGTVANKVHIYTKNTGGGAAPTHNERLTVDKNGLVGIGTTSPTAQLDVAGTGAVRVPRGTSAQRPFGLAGILRFNTDADILEWHDGSDWQSINPGTGGEVNVGQNVGDGAGEVYKDKSGVSLRLKTIKAGSGVTVTNNADDVTIAATGGGGSSAPVVITPSEITTNQNNYSPTGWADADIVRLSSSDIWAITSFDATGQINGRTKTLFNVGQNNIYFPGEHTGGSANNRISVETDVFLPPNQSCKIVYDSVSLRWRVDGRPTSIPRMVEWNQTLAFATAGALDVLAGSAISGGGTSSSFQGNDGLPSGGELTTQSSSSGGGAFSIPRSVLYAGSIGYTHFIYTTVVSIPILSDASQSYTFEMQINTSASENISQNNSIGFRYSHDINGGRWLGYAKDGSGGESSVDLGVTVEAIKVYSLTLCVSKDGTESRFYVNGEPLGRVSANHPSSGTEVMARTVLIKSAGTTDRRVRVSQLNIKSIY